MWLETVYWLCVAVAVYPFIGYPLIAALRARWSRRRVPQPETAPQPMSIVVACYNEAPRIGRRVSELSRLAAALHRESEVIVVSDGSTDTTVAEVRSLAADNVRVIELPANQGKANALNHGVAAARHDLVAFADARQSWDVDTLRRLSDRFAEPAIGAVSGDLVLRSASGSLRTVDFYWRLEKRLRINESRWYSAIGVTGAVCAVRRSLFPTVPPGTVLDDVYWPMAVVLQGFRVVHEPRAVAYDQLPQEIGDEYQRKVRTLAGNFQLLSLMPRLLLPWKNPAWFQFVSHKLLRLATPWLLLAAWGVSLALVSKPLYAVLFALQTVSTLVAALAYRSPPVRRIRPLGIAAGVFAMNYAAWMAFWVWLSNRTAQAWKKARYADSDASPAP